MNVLKDELYNYINKIKLNLTEINDKNKKMKNYILLKK